MNTKLRFDCRGKAKEDFENDNIEKKEEDKKVEELGEVMEADTKTSLMSARRRGTSENKGQQTSPTMPTSTSHEPLIPYSF